MTNWILKNGTTQQDCTTFPFAYRAAYNIVRRAVDEKQNVAAAMRAITILGPPDGRGKRPSYSYAAASQFARESGLLSGEGTGSINAREFKKR
jgi:hypothetical protein